MSAKYSCVLLLIVCLLTVPAATQATEQPVQVMLVGTIEGELAFDAVGLIWSGVFDLPSGDHEFQVVVDGAVVGEVPQFTLLESRQVRLIYDHATGWVTNDASGIIANVPGSFQSEIGCPGDWQPWCLQTLLQDLDGDGLYIFATRAIPPGLYEAKVAYNESWDLNYGTNGTRNGPNILFSVLEEGQEVVFLYDPATHIMTITVDGSSGPAVGNLFLSAALWLTQDTIVWNISRIPGAAYQLHFSPTADLILTDSGIEGGETIDLEFDPNVRLGVDLRTRHPQLGGNFLVLTIPANQVGRVPEILQGQVAVSMRHDNGSVFGDATGVQIWGVLDDLYADAAYDEPLGVIYDGNVPTLRVWAPTAQSVRLLHYEDAFTADAEIIDMTPDDVTGIWEVTGIPEWTGTFYLYEIVVHAPAAHTIVTNQVTDPYSVSLAMNSTRSQIIDLSDPALFPAGWAERSVPSVEAFEDIVLYELHVRDFSVFDESVPPDERGTFRAFTHLNSNGMRHLHTLSQAGLSHLHLLPAFDIATINENPAERVNPSITELAGYPSDSETQQAIIGAVRSQDSFNWGYDPYHFNVPEGSYSTNANGAQRILEFREMVMVLNSNGLNVVMDVVYNHTSAAGQDAHSVLDRVVPGYYHRLNAEGRVETSTCCQNTATEHRMMEKLMIDSALLWVTQYGVNGFRFDLMGHHMVDNMTSLRAALDKLSIVDDGVNGRSIYVYGEGWDFGEMANNARGVNATQLNMAGTGIGTFNDRLRDAVRGGGPFSGWEEQGFITGLFTDPNVTETRTPQAQRQMLLVFADHIRAGLSGNLRDYTFTTATGQLRASSHLGYGNPPGSVGYTLDPQEHIAYISAHDNETIWDAIQMKAPDSATVEDRVRMHNLGMSIILLSQGIPFIHAGDDLLRSKSLDRNSYDSGDWFNGIDWTRQTNNWARGLPPAWDNQDRWDIMRPLLSNPDLAVTTTEITNAAAHVQEMLHIRFSSPLFRLRNADDIIQRLTFLNTGPGQIPGVIVMRLVDTTGEELDPNYSEIVVIFNASTATLTFTDAALPTGYSLHPIQQASNDSVVREAAYIDGAFIVPTRTTAVFVRDL
jgi:pullulanase